MAFKREKNPLALEGEMNDEAEPSTPTRGSVVKIKFNGAHG